MWCPKPATVLTGMRQMDEKASTKPGPGLGNPKHVEFGFAHPTRFPLTRPISKLWKRAAFIFILGAYKNTEDWPEVTVFKMFPD